MGADEGRQSGAGITGQKAKVHRRFDRAANTKCGPYSAEAVPYHTGRCNGSHAGFFFYDARPGGAATATHGSRSPAAARHDAHCQKADYNCTCS